jgi:hypothetical protein
VIVAAIRGTEPTGIVILLTLLTPVGGVMWFGAWIAVFMFPRRRPERASRPNPASRARPYWDDPRYLFGAIPYTDTADAARHQAAAGDR